MGWSIAMQNAILVARSAAMPPMSRPRSRAWLFRKAHGEAEKLCIMAHVRMESCNGLVVNTEFTHAIDAAEREGCADHAGAHGRVPPNYAEAGQRTTTPAAFVAALRKMQDKCHPARGPECHQPVFRYRRSHDAPSRLGPFSENLQMDRWGVLMGKDLRHHAQELPRQAAACRQSRRTLARTPDKWEPPFTGHLGQRGHGVGTSPPARALKSAILLPFYSACLGARIGSWISLRKLSRRRPCLMGNKVVHIEGQIGDSGFCLGALDANGMDEQVHFRRLMSKNVLGAGANAGFGGVAAPDIRRHRFAFGLPAMNAADPALGLEPALIALAAIDRFRPDVRGGVVVGDDIEQHAPIVAGLVCRLALADKAKDPADDDSGFVAKAGDGNIGLRPAINGGGGLGEFQRPARVGVFLPRLGRFVWPDLGGAPAFLHRHSLGLGVPLLGRCHQCGVDDLPAHGQIAAVPQLMVEISKQCVERAALVSRSRNSLIVLASGVAAPRSKPETATNSTARGSAIPCTRQRRCSVRQAPHIEQHDHRIIGRVAALGPTRVGQRFEQGRPKRFKVDDLGQDLRQITASYDPIDRKAPIATSAGPTVRRQ